MSEEIIDGLRKEIASMKAQSEMDAAFYRVTLAERNYERELNSGLRALLESALKGRPS